MRVFLDSNVLLKYLAGMEEARSVVERVERGEWTGYINDVVVSEVVYGYLRLALAAPRHRIRSLVASRREEVGRLLMHDVYPLLSRLQLLPTCVGPEPVIRLAMEYGLLPNDAVIAATCRRHGIGVIATFDDDFRRVPWLKVVP